MQIVIPINLQMVLWFFICLSAVSFISYKLMHLLASTASDHWEKNKWAYLLKGGIFKKAWGEHGESVISATGISLFIFTIATGATAAIILFVASYLALINGISYLGTIFGIG